MLLCRLLYLHLPLTLYQSHQWSSRLLLLLLPQVMLRCQLLHMLLHLLCRLLLHVLCRLQVRLVRQLVGGQMRAKCVWRQATQEQGQASRIEAGAVAH